MVFRIRDLNPRVKAESKLPGVCGHPADSKARGPILFGGGIERIQRLQSPIRTFEVSSGKAADAVMQELGGSGGLG
jgi:hypothetical protein